MRREHYILSTLWKELSIAPRSLHLCTDSDIIGVPFHILEFRSGIAIRGDFLEDEFNSTEIGEKLSRILVSTLASVHEVDIEAANLTKLGRPQGFFSRHMEGWIKRATDAANGAPPTIVKDIEQWLRANAPADDGSSVLLHSDFKLDNLLLDPETISVTSLIDWDMGTRGPALFDLATLLSYWTEPGDPDCMQRLAQMPTASPGFLRREGVAHLYEKLTARSIADMRPWRVLTILKLAVVFLQLFKRYKNGQISDLRYKEFECLGEGLYLFALDVAYGRFF